MRELAARLAEPNPCRGEAEADRHDHLDLASLADVALEGERCLVAIGAAVCGASAWRASRVEAIDAEIGRRRAGR